MVNSYHGQLVTGVDYIFRPRDRQLDLIQAIFRPRVCGLWLWLWLVLVLIGSGFGRQMENSPVVYICLFHGRKITPSHHSCFSVICWPGIYRTFVTSWLQTWKRLDTCCLSINTAIEQNAIYFTIPYVLHNHRQTSSLMHQKYWYIIIYVGRLLICIILRIAKTVRSCRSCI